MQNSIKYALIVGAILVGGTVGLVVYMSNQGGSMSSSQSTADAVMTDKIEIKGYAFEPQTITVKKGTKVTWTNNDRVEHTVTSREGAPAMFDSKLFGQGKSYSYTFETAGSYEYYCKPHPYMKGTVVVTE